MTVSEFDSIMDKVPMARSEPVYEPLDAADDPPWKREPAIGGRPAHRPGLKTHTMADLVTMSVEPPPMLIEGTIPEVGLTVLAGPPKVGKTLWASQVALVVAAEGSQPNFLGRSSGSGPVLIIVEEGSIAGISWRLKHQSAAMGIETARLQVAHRQRVRLDAPGSVVQLREFVEGYKPALVILDPLNRLHGADENRPTQMTPVMDALAGIAYDFKCAVLAIHHLSKPSSERTGPIWDRFRGATSIRSGTDANLALEGSGTTAQLFGEFRDAEPLSEYLELDRETLTFRQVDGPTVSRKVEPAELRAYIEAEGQATVATIAARFGVTRPTARVSVENLPDIDWYDGPRRTRFYTLGTGK